MQVMYVEELAGLPKGAADRSRLEWKGPVVVVYLATDYIPRLRRVFEAPDSIPLRGMFEVSDSAGLRFWIVVAEEEVGDLSLAACGMNRKPHDVIHRHVRSSLVAALEKLGQGIEFVCCRPSRAAFRLRN